MGTFLTSTSNRGWENIGTVKLTNNQIIKPPLGNEWLQSPDQLQINNDPTLLPLNTQTTMHPPSVKAGIIWSKVVQKIPALASIMHQNASSSQVILLPTPLIKSAFWFYNKSTDSDKAAALRTLELIKKFLYMLITAHSQVTFQDRWERVRYIGK